MSNATDRTNAKPGAVHAGGISAPNRWRAEWSNSPALQEQFPSAESYAEHMAKLEREKGTPATASSPMSETQRIAAIDSLALPGHEVLVSQLKADPSIGVGQAAIRIATAEKARRESAQAPAAVVPFSQGAKTTGPINIFAVRRQALADWENSAELQREFTTAEAHANYQLAVAQGRVRIYRGPNNAA